MCFNLSLLTILYSSGPHVFPPAHSLLFLRQQCQRNCANQSIRVFNVSRHIFATVKLSAQWTSRNVRTMFVQCSYNVRTMFVQCSYNVRTMFVQWQKKVRTMFVQCPTKLRTILYELLFAILYEIVRTLCVPSCTSTFDGISKNTSRQAHTSYRDSAISPVLHLILTLSLLYWHSFGQT